MMDLSFIEMKKMFDMYRDYEYDYENGLNRIKIYLVEHGINVTDVIRWQSGFRHEGTPYGLEIMATVIVDDIEERYCIPKHVIKGNEILKFLKIGDGEVRPRSDKPSNP